MLGFFTNHLPTNNQLLALGRQNKNNVSMYIGLVGDKNLFFFGQLIELTDFLSEF
jgi:hypothetical protein